MPKKIIKLALADALRSKITADQISIFSSTKAIIKTSQINLLLKKNGFEKVLFVINDNNTFIEKSVRNIKNVKAIYAKALNVYDILNFDHLIFENDLIESKIIKAIE
jgi:ribosomal protein L4